MSDLHELYANAEKLKDEGQHEAAIEALNDLLDQDGSHVLSHLALAVLYGKVNEHDKAIEHGRRACELDPKDAFGFTALSVTYQRAWQGTQKQEYIQLAEEAMAKAHVIEGRG